MSNSKKPFVDFRAIRARVTMEQVLDHYGVLGTFKRTGSRLSGPCPIHNGSNPTQFRVETDKNLWNFFSECKHGGNVLDFIAKKEDIAIHDAALKACEWFGIPLDEVKTTGSGNEPELPAATPPDPTAKPAKAAPPPPAPENTEPNPPLKFRLDKLDRAHPYFTERGISQEAIIDFGLGYFTGDKGIMVGRIAIPIHNVKGEVVAYAGRWPGNPPDGTPKYRLPTGFRKGLELFNLDRAIQEPADKPLVIVEGFFDAVKLHQHGCRKVVSLMGSSLSVAQEELICKHTNGQSQAIVMLDEDDAGRAGREAGDEPWRWKCGRRRRRAYHQRRNLAPPAHCWTCRTLGGGENRIQKTTFQHRPVGNCLQEQFSGGSPEEKGPTAPIGSAGRPCCVARRPV